MLMIIVILMIHNNNNITTTTTTTNNNNDNNNNSNTNYYYLYNDTDKYPRPLAANDGRATDTQIDFDVNVMFLLPFWAIFDVNVFVAKLMLMFL